MEDTEQQIFVRGNGADDEDSRSGSESDGEEIEVVGSSRDHRGDGPDHAARWRERYQEHGYSGQWDYRKRSPSPKRIAVEVLEQVLQLYREKYFDFNVQHFHEKLEEERGVKQSDTWVKTALQEAGLV